MSKYKIGDVVTVLYIQNSDLSLQLIPAAQRNDHEGLLEHKVQIVGLDNRHFIILCSFDPHSYFSQKIDDDDIIDYNISLKFLGQMAAVIDENFIWEPAIKTSAQIHSNDPGGCGCVICHNFIQYADPNLPNGGFVCRTCRQTRTYMVRPYLEKNGIEAETVGWIK
jgi:hypothetical protein